MDGDSDKVKKTGSVRSALNFYGQRMSEGYSPTRKGLKDVSENSSPRKRELHSSRRDGSQFRESTRNAEAAKAKTESEISDAKKIVKDLASRIEESNSRVKKIEEPEKQNKPKGCGADERCSRNEDNHYTEVMQKVEYIKMEVRKLKADMTFVIDQKKQADAETYTSGSRIKAYSSSVEPFRKEINEINEIKYDRASKYGNLNKNRLRFYHNLLSKDTLICSYHPLGFIPSETTLSFQC